MNGCFTFRFQEINAIKRSSLVIFFSADISADIIGKETKIDVEQNLVPDSLYVIASLDKLNEMQALFQNASLLAEIDSFVGEPLRKLKLISFNNDGKLSEVSTGKIISEELQLTLIREGMLNIFKKRKGLIVASKNYHFLKPSGDHCENFIRASNLLIAGDEVAFLSLSLLPYLHEKIKKIYVDTSSISYLVSTAILMSSKFHDNVPVIESFESYAFFSQRFDFVEDKNSLVFISATTSGSLATKLKNRTSFEKNQIITLFYSYLRAGQEGIFDISKIMPKTTSSFKHEDCQLCKNSSRLIRIVGDQFLPDTPANEQLLIRKTDFTKDRQEFFKEFASKGILKWRVLPNLVASSTEHFFIDISAVLTSPSKEFSNILLSKINKHFSRDVRTVIILNDAGSIAFGNEIKEKINVDGSAVNWVTLDGVEDVDLKNGASVVVVAGAITSGRKLLSASRKLRVLNNKSSITYFVGFSKLPTADDLNQLKRDLEMGGHELVVLRKCPMPRITSQTRTAWDVECDELMKWDDDNPFSKGSLPPLLLARLEFLRNGVPSENQLFFPTNSGDLLQLRQSFAFWSGIEISIATATQSDVYWTMQSILHDLRMKIDGGLGSIYHTTVISPACFDRYNDGVIQAALLRAASPLELNYSIDENFSRKMADIVISIINNIDNDQGEAALEFIFALWVGRLRLYDIHLTEIINNFTKNNYNSDLNFLILRLAERQHVS
jgi:hypothetical protein